MLKSSVGKEQPSETATNHASWDWKKLLKPCALVGSAALALWVTFEIAGSKLAEARPERQLVGEGSVSALDYADYLIAGTAGFAAVGAVALGVLGYVAKQVHDAERVNDHLFDGARAPMDALETIGMSGLLPGDTVDLQAQQNTPPARLSDLLAA